MDDMTASEVEACMRGCAGSVAVLTIAGPSPNSPHRLVDLERRALPQPPVQQVCVCTAQTCTAVYCCSQVVLLVLAELEAGAESNEMCGTASLS